MLKGKRTVSACSLSSCRIRAEALARAFNNRIWPCVWLAQRSSSAERDDGMSNGIDDEEEFFDASPSPENLEHESLFCKQHSSAATEAGRAKLYELLQQHAGDDAIDVFYDVSEDAGLTRTASDTCLKNQAKISGQVDKVCQSCKHLDDEPCFSNNSENNAKDNGSIFCVNSQINSESVEIELQESLDSGLCEKFQQISSCSEHSLTCSSICEECHDDTVRNGFANSEDDSDHLVKTENMVSEEDETEEKHEEESSSVVQCNVQKTVDDTVRNGFTNSEDDSDHLLKTENMVSEEDETEEKHEAESSSVVHCNVQKAVEDHVLDENKEIAVRKENDEISNLPSADSDSIIPTSETEENSLKAKEEQVDNIPDSTTESEITVDKGNRIVVQVIKELDDSPSAASDIVDVKTTSPTCRLRVFDELRPKISRSTSLKTGKTPPGTPSKKKIVRFADVLGLDLEDIRHIMTGDLPVIPSSAYTDLDLKDSDLPTREPISKAVEISRRDSTGWNTTQRATATNVLYPMFSNPGEQPDFMDRVRFQGICLETIIVSEMSVQCTCRVMNYGYHKKVIARYTLNDWQSTNNIDASYVLGSSNGETDKFAFSIFLSPYNRSVKFALKYEVNSKEYWDNNKNQNYCLNYHEDNQMQHIPSPLWTHQFW